MRRAGLALVLVFFAGCFQPPSSPLEENLKAPPVPAAEAVATAFTRIPSPSFDATAAVSRWETFVNDHPKRDWNYPHNVAAAAYLEQELTAMGYAAKTIEYPAAGAAPQLPASIKVVRGVLAAPNATHRIALVAHYDVHPMTLQGAYDDGAGTMVQLEICRLLAQQKAALRHTVECLFFDAEERGLVASREYVSRLNATQDGFTYALAFGYDMTGINWPGHEWRLYAMVGTNEATAELQDPFTAFLEEVLHVNFEGVIAGARDGIRILDVHDRNSDEMNFKRAGIPIVRFAGGRNAADYPMYHQPGDVVPYVYQFTGGRENFEKGFRAVVLASYYAILSFDAFDVRALPTE